MLDLLVTSLAETIQPILYLGLFLATIIVYFLISKSNDHRIQARHVKAFGLLHGAKTPPQVPNQRPFGIDRLEQIIRANNESRLMEHFLFHFRQTGWTLKQVFFGDTVYETADPANLESIMSSNFKDWSLGVRRKIMFPLFGEGIFVQEGESWKTSRDILRPQFHHRAYANLDVFRGSVDDLLENMSAGGVVDLQPLFFRLTLDTTTAFLFGESVQSLRDAATTGEQTFAEAFNVAQDIIATKFQLPGIYWLIGGQCFRDACRKVHEFADQIIDRNLLASTKRENEGSYVFLRSLAEKTSDRELLRGQIINILIAGRDTTACLLSWTFFLLVRHPAALSKLRAEIQSNCGPDERDLDRDTLCGMTYLQNVLKETLRLYPSVPVNTRTALETTILPTGGGPDGKSPALIPKGSAMAFSVYSMHRRPDLYGMDAEVFRPERWDEDLPMNRNPTLARWGYLPFHGGQRVCLGMDFALTEAAYTVVRIIRRFPRLKIPEGTNVEITGLEKQKMTLVISSAEGCRVDLG